MFSKALIILTFIILSILRFINLDKFPIFGDESLYLSLSDNLVQNPHTYLKSISFGVMPIFIWIQAIFLNFNQGIINLLTLGRGLNVIFDLLSTILVFQIGKKLFSERLGFFAAIIYLSLPISFLHSRLVLLESSTNFFSLLSLFLVLNIFLPQKSKTIDFKKNLIASFCLAISYFTKPLSIIIFPVVFFIPLIPIFEQKLFNFKKNKSPLLNLFVILIATTIMISIFYLPISQEFSQRYITDNSSPSAMIAIFKANLWRFFWWSKVYFTIPILAILPFSLFFILIRKNIRAFWILFWIISAILLSTLNAAHFYPRHLYLLAAPISLLTAFLISFIFKFRNYLGYLILSLILIPSWLLNFKILIDPVSAPIALEDRQQFFEDWSSGINIDKVSQRLNAEAKNKKIIIYVESEPSQFWVLSRLYPIKNSQIIPSDNLFISKFLESQLITNKNITSYIVLNKNPDPPKDWPVEKVTSFPKGPNRQISIFKIKSF